MLSICYAGGNLGAALFNTYRSCLETSLTSPLRYEMLTSLVYHIGERQAATDIAGVSETGSDDRIGDGGGGHCISLMMRPGMEFGLTSCLMRVERMEMQGKPFTCEQEQMVKLSLFIDFSCNSLVRAASSEKCVRELPDRLRHGDPHGAVHQQPGAVHQLPGAVNQQSGAVHQQPGAGADPHSL
jgi:hypothetical protein